MNHNTQNNINMQHSPGNVPGTVLMSVLAAASGLFGFIEHLDVILGVLAKMIAVIAGTVSLMVAYQTYLTNKENQKKDKSNKTS